MVHGGGLRTHGAQSNNVTCQRSADNAVVVAQSLSQAASVPYRRYRGPRVRRTWRKKQVFRVYNIHTYTHNAGRGHEPALLRIHTRSAQLVFSANIIIVVAIRAHDSRAAVVVRVYPLHLILPSPQKTRSPSGEEETTNEKNRHRQNAAIRVAPNVQPSDSRGQNCAERLTTTTTVATPSSDHRIPRRRSTAAISHVSQTFSATEWGENPRNTVVRLRREHPSANIMDPRVQPSGKYFSGKHCSSQERIQNSLIWWCRLLVTNKAIHFYVCTYL